MMAMITTQMMDNSEETVHGTIFRTLDLDSDGVIGRDELETVFVETGRASVEQIDSIMKNCDFNSSKSITYTEFLTASIDWTKEFRSDRLDLLMNYFDILRKGSLTRKELKAIFTGVREKEWDEFFNIADSNRDGLISVQELKTYFLQISDSQ